jgi:RND family efflux transporter MFP subunit
MGRCHNEIVKTGNKNVHKHIPINEAEETMKKTRFTVLCVCCAIALSGFNGCGKLKDFGKKKAETVAQRIKMDVVVDTAVRRTINQERKLLGTLSAYRETDIAPLSMGSVRVRYLPVKIGDYVEQGKIVAKMDDASYVTTQAQFASIKSQYERSKALYEANALSKAQFEGVEAQYTGMKRQLETMEENTVLKAPFSGVITAKSVEEGELYSTPMTPGASKGLVRITQLNPLKIDLDVDDQTVRFIKKGMQVDLTVSNSADSVPIIGKVDWVNPVANSMSRTFSVRIIVQNPDRKLLPGYFAEAHILIGKKENSLTVPREALVDDLVFVMKDSIAIAKKVETGMMTENVAEILSGVSERDIVVVKGNKALPDSAVVNIVVGK